jgi:glycerol-3-phosphate O-acyltransferase / dihydroxyacetone phosphate acyltransferase
MFSNPISRAILTSSGSIPVHRNTGSSSSRAASNPPSMSLFEETSAALANGAAVGVFPEGTSYTEPRIMQVKDGAARAAMEYSKRIGGKGPKDIQELEALVMVPVGIIYTNKSQYRSRVSRAVPPFYNQFVYYTCPFIRL